MKGYQKLLVVGMVALLTLGLVGCINDSDVDPSKSPVPSINPPNVTISPIPTSTPADGLVLKDLDNQDVSLSSFQGKRVLMVFWNLLCSSNKNKLSSLKTLNELAVLQELNDAQIENLVILAVTNQDSGSIAEVKSYVTEQKLNYQFLYDETGKTYEEYKIKLVPHTVLLDANGKVAYEHEGEMSKEDYLKILNETPNPTIKPTVKPSASVKPSPIPSVNPTIAPGKNDFTLQDITGKNVSLADYRGKKVLLVFWSTGCGPCIAELPAIQELKDKNLKDVVILTICSTTNLDTIKEKVKNYTFTTLQDKNGKVFDQYNISGTPTNTYIDREGKIYKTQVGSNPNVDSYISILNKMP